MEHVFGPDFMGVDPSGEKSDIGKSEVFRFDEIYSWFLSYMGVEFVVLSVWSVEMSVSVLIGVVVS
jgi:hypothetical protein